MDALEELKKRQEAKEQEQQAALKQEWRDRENDLLKTKNEILAEIQKYKNLDVDRTAKDKGYNKDSHILDKMYDAIATEKASIYIATKEQSAEYDVLSSNNIAEHMAELERMRNHQPLTTKESIAASMRQSEVEAAREAMYFPSMAMLIKRGCFDQQSWFTIVEKGHLPDYTNNGLFFYQKTVIWRTSLLRRCVGQKNGLMRKNQKNLKMMKNEEK